MEGLKTKREGDNIFDNPGRAGQEVVLPAQQDASSVF